MKEEIPTSEYMVDGWDRGPTGCHHYKRGSFHNKLGMWIMFIFYGIILVQVIHAMTVLPFFPITCLLYTSPSPRDATLARMPSSA